MGDTATLVARTRRLDRDPDLLAEAGRDGVLFTREGSGLAGRGCALRLPVEEVEKRLAEVDLDDEVGRPGCGPVAFGALPFRPDDPAELIVPARIVGRAADGTRWTTTIEGPRTDAPPAERAPGATGPGRFTVESSRPPQDWCDDVTTATDAIRAGRLDKVVLAREVLVHADREIDAAAVLARLAQVYPACHLFSVDGFVGASPELLVSRHGDVVRAQPMAGTTGRRGDPVADTRLAAALLASPTYRFEHQVTIDMVHDTLLAYCSYLDYEAEPSVVTLANVAHLATMVEGRLSRPPASVLELVRALHPTPAVCGRPRAEALALISELEHLDRGRYAGAVGWIDAAGNGEWAVSIRCAQLEGDRARLYAGNGIVADSDPVTELAETRAKLQAMLSAIVRP